jgi:hypothetical protein
MRNVRNACIFGAVLFAAIATAADPRAISADTREADVREARAARVEARRGGLTDIGDAQNEKNRYARCDAHQGADRDYCIRRMNGEGTVSGSVEGGGVLRELRVIVPAE